MTIKKFSGTFLATSLLATATFIIVPTVQAQSDKFMCQSDNEAIPTTYANTPDGPKPFIKWDSTHFSESSYTPMKRCQEVTTRLNQFHAEDKLEYIITGWINGLPVFCVTQTCSEDTVLLTLKPKQDPNQALEEMKATRAGTSGPTYQSGGIGDAPVVLNVQKYLDDAPVERPSSAANSIPDPTTSSDPTPSTSENSGSLF